MFENHWFADCMSAYRCSLFAACVLFVVGTTAADEAPLLVPLHDSVRGTIELPDAVREKCVQVLREGIRSTEFWPSIHAAEGLTIGGYGVEVRRALEPKLLAETDDQRRCGLARELVRTGDKHHSAVMLGILVGQDSHGHVHAAESLYKVGEIGDGKAMRAAMAQQEDLRLQLPCDDWTSSLRKPPRRCVAFPQREISC